MGGKNPGFFYQKPNPVGSTSLIWVLMGFAGETGEYSDSLRKFRIEEPNLKNEKIILHKINN